jgi:predicted porin
MYELDKWNAQLWHYKQNNAIDMTYAEVSINPMNNLAMSLQYITQKDNVTGKKGKSWGTTADYTLTDITFSADYNKTSGTNGVVNGFGGGPYFTSAEQNTIDGITDIRAYAIGIEYAGINNLTLGIRKIDFDQGIGDELDINASYQIRDNWTADLIISDMDIDGKNTRFFINYDLNI